MKKIMILLIVFFIIGCFAYRINKDCNYKINKTIPNCKYIIKSTIGYLDSKSNGIEVRVYYTNTNDLFLENGYVCFKNIKDGKIYFLSNYNLEIIMNEVEK